jgi:hypothetical protein
MPDRSEERGASNPINTNRGCGPSSKKCFWSPERGPYGPLRGVCLGSIGEAPTSRFGRLTSRPTAAQRPVQNSGLATSQRPRAPCLAWRARGLVPRLRARGLSCRRPGRRDCCSLQQCCVPRRRFHARIVASPSACGSRGYGFEPRRPPHSPARRAAWSGTDIAAVGCSVSTVPWDRALPRAVSSTSGRTSRRTTPTGSGRPCESMPLSWARCFLSA